MAGLWERWKSPEGNIIESFNIITTEANEFMKPIHNRMPVILKQEDEKKWLSSKISAEILSLLKPYASEEMDAFPVSKLVNSPRNAGREVWVKEKLE
jgi:putative SOS response-associated peptidase YedK